MVGDVCPGNCCGGGVVSDVNVVSSGIAVVIVLKVVSSGFTVEEDSGFAVVPVVGVVCPGNCCGGGEVPGVNVVSSGLTVEGILEVVSCGFIVDEVVDVLVGVVCPGVVSKVVGEVSSGFIVVMVVCVVDSGLTVVIVVCAVDGVVNSGFNVVAVVPDVVDSGPTVAGVVIVSGFGVVGDVCVVVVDCSGFRVVMFPGNFKESDELNSLMVYC